MSQTNLTSLVLRDEDVQWIVNDHGELGVLIAGQAFFMYKAESIRYDPSLDDDHAPTMYRTVRKREFGASGPHSDSDDCYYESERDEFEWKKLPPLLTPSV